MFGLRAAPNPRQMVPLATSVTRVADGSNFKVSVDYVQSFTGWSVTLQRVVSGTPTAAYGGTAGNVQSTPLSNADISSSEWYIHWALDGGGPSDKGPSGRVFP